ASSAAPSASSTAFLLTALGIRCHACRQQATEKSRSLRSLATAAHSLPPVTACESGPNDRGCFACRLCGTELNVIFTTCSLLRESGRWGVSVHPNGADKGNIGEASPATCIIVRRRVCSRSLFNRFLCCLVLSVLVVFLATIDPAVLSAIISQ